MSRSSAFACEVCGAPLDRDAALAWRKDGYSIMRCSQCGLLFRSKLPTDGELPVLYGEDYFRAGTLGSAGEGYPDYIGTGELHRRNACKRLRVIEDYVQPGALLDVGCAAGFFLDEARGRGWSVQGIELSSQMAAHARDQLGLEVVAAPFGAVEIGSTTVDCVTMWDYIEHSREPAEDIRRVHSLLRPGGILALSTGDAGSLFARISGKRWHLLTPRHHNYYFSRSTLSRLLFAVGFRIRLCKAFASLYSVEYLAHKLRTVTGVSVLDRLAGRLTGTAVGQVSVPVNLWDIVTVVAEKPRP